MAVEKTKPCYLCWFFTILLGIAAGTLLADAIKAGINYIFFQETIFSSTQNIEKTDSSENKPRLKVKNETDKKELPTVKLSPKKEIPSIKLIPNEESKDKDMFIKVLPDKESKKDDTPKESKPGYQTTLQTCTYWTKEYKKEATKQNEAYMEAACTRLKSYE
jgi:hypothetical protein